MVAKRTFITYDDFSGGEMGNMAPVNSTKHFRAINIWRYQNGGIGPRSPITTNQPTALTARAMAMVNKNRDGRLIAVFDNNTVQYFFPGSGATVTATPAPRTPSDAVVVGSDVVYISSAGTGFEFTALNIVALPNLPAGVLIEKYRQRFVAASGAAEPGPGFRFSALDDPATWPAANTFNIGSDGISELWVQRNTLIIPDDAGNFHRISGVLGVNETLSRIDQGPTVSQAGYGFIHRAYGGAVLSGNIWFPDGQILARFDGASIATRPPMTAPATQGSILFGSTRPAFIQGWDDDEFFWAYAINSSSPGGVAPWDRLGITHHHSDGAFTQHLVPVTAFTPTAGFPEVFAVTYGRSSAEFVLNGNTAGAVTAKVFSLTSAPSQADFPDTGANDGNSGAPVSATFRTADWHAPDGMEVFVEAIIIDYSFYSGNTNSVTVAVESTQPVDTNTIRASTGQVFVPTSNAQFPDSSIVQRGRQVFRMGDQAASGWFRILLSSWTGILINKITAVVSLQEARI